MSCNIYMGISSPPMSLSYIANSQSSFFTSDGNQSSMSQLQTTGVNDQIVGSIASNIAKGLFRYLVLSCNKTCYCSYIKCHEIFMELFVSEWWCHNFALVFGTFMQHWRECSCLPKCTPVSHWAAGVWGDWQCCQWPNEVSKFFIVLQPAAILLNRWWVLKYSPCYLLYLWEGIYHKNPCYVI